MKAAKWIISSALVTALAGCGAEKIESPGTSGNVTINNNAPPPAPAPPPPAPSPTLATPATGCPTIPDPAGLHDGGTITGPTGEYRVCELPNRFTVSTTLEKFPGLLYSINGRVDVGLDRGAAPTADAAVVLTIRPGVVLYGATGTSWLAVNRGNRIMAVGAADSPIIFTSRDNVLGLSSDDLSRTMGRRRAARPRSDHGLHGGSRGNSRLGELRAPDRRFRRPCLLRRRDCRTTTAARSTSSRSAIRATSSPATASCSR